MNPSTALARVIIDELVRSGVTDLVLAPGSRSTPLALAAAEAERYGQVRLHVRVDERSAAFLALGMAKVDRVPVAVITTSGTAAANLHPAVIEASFAGVPLILLTADRPPQLRGTGANQTIDQVGIFGTDARWSIDLGAALSETGQVRYWRSVVSKSVAVARDSTDAGPVHLNVGFGEPLVPTGDDEWVEPLGGRPDGRRWTTDARLLAEMATPIDELLAGVLGDATVPARGLVIVGDHDEPESVSLVDELAGILDWPVISEATGGAGEVETSLRHGPLILADPTFASEHRPDVVLTVGRVGITRSILGVIRSAALHIAVDPRPLQRLADPLRTADIVLSSVPLPPEADFESDGAWLDEWMAADEIAATAVSDVLSAKSEDVLSGAEVAIAVTVQAGPEGLLIVGPSWSIRHVEAFTGGGTLITLANRGTSGIDGVVSTAWGAALAAQRTEDGSTGETAYCLLGDLSLLYDSNGLMAPNTEVEPDLVYVVVDNNGGGIFSQLEQGAPEFEDSFERVFGTPHDVDVAAVVAAHGIPVTTVESLTELLEAMQEAATGGGVRVIVVRTMPRAAEAQLLRDISTAVSTGLRQG